MSMSAAQNAAFQAASGVSPAALITLWLAWLLLSLYKGWASGNLKPDAAGGSALRGLLLYAVMTWLILH